MGHITWSKEWSSSDDGSPFAGADIENIQDNITAQVNGSIDADNLAATLTFADGDFLNLAAILHNDTAVQGLRLPQIGTSPSSPTTGEGYIGWDETNNNIEAYSGSAWVTVPTIASAAQGDVMYYNGTIWTRLAAGTAGQAVTTGGASANPSFAGITTQGDIEYHNGTTRTRLAAGTSGNFLKTQGAGANPVWAAALESGTWSSDGVIAKDTIYQNTSGKKMRIVGALGVSTTGSNYAQLEIDDATPPTDQHAQFGSVSGGAGGPTDLRLFFYSEVPNNWYYRVTTSAGTITMARSRTLEE